MKQNEEKSQKDQELTKEELEQVNGGTPFLTPPFPRKEQVSHWDRYLGMMTAMTQVPSYILFIFALKINHYQQTIIMKQNEENSQKAQELTKEELEQVNGGGFLPRPKGKAL